MKTHTCEFVLGSEFFDGFDSIHQCLSDRGDFTWGDCNRSLVDVRSIYNSVCDEDVDDRFMNHCSNVGWNMYVDLEN